MRNKVYFPLFMDIQDRQIVVVGAGKIAARRVNTLLPFCDRITVIGPRVEPSLKELAQAGRITLWERAYRREDIYDAWMVLAATDNEALNDEIYSVAKCLGALVNVASNQSKCDFHFPGIVRKDPYVIGINAAGQDHSGTAALRKKIEKVLE